MDPGYEMDMRNGSVEVNNEEMSGRGFNQDKPPEDDCCPICFGEFKVPCRANCGHWFCGGCVLQLWEYRSRPRRCKCPFCSSPISELTPEASVINETEIEVAEVFENIEHYNSFYLEGARGFYLLLAFYLRKHGPLLHLHIWSLFRALVLFVITSPSFFMGALVGLIRHPGRIHLYLPRVRVIACTLCLLLHLYHGFLPSGYLKVKVSKIKLLIDCASIILVVCPYAVIMCKTWVYIMWLRFLIWKVRREIDALQARDAVLREQEVVLQERADVLGGREVELEENALLLEKDETEAPLQVDARTEKDETEAPLSRRSTTQRCL